MTGTVPTIFLLEFLLYRAKRNSPELFIFERDFFLNGFFTPGKRFELLRCRAPVAFKATAFPD
jgi:hypothetical protein